MIKPTQVPKELRELCKGVSAAWVNSKGQHTECRCSNECPMHANVCAGEVGGCAVVSRKTYCAHVTLYTATEGTVVLPTRRLQVNAGCPMSSVIDKFESPEFAGLPTAGPDEWVDVARNSSECFFVQWTRRGSGHLPVVTAYAVMSLDNGVRYGKAMAALDASKVVWSDFSVLSNWVPGRHLLVTEACALRGHLNSNEEVIYAKIHERCAAAIVAVKNDRNAAWKLTAHLRAELAQSNKENFALKEAARKASQRCRRDEEFRGLSTRAETLFRERDEARRQSAGLFTRVREMEAQLKKMRADADCARSRANACGKKIEELVVANRELETQLKKNTCDARIKELIIANQKLETALKEERSQHMLHKQRWNAETHRHASFMEVHQREMKGQRDLLEQAHRENGRLVKMLEGAQMHALRQSARADEIRAKLMTALGSKPDGSKAFQFTRARARLVESAPCLQR